MTERAKRSLVQKVRQKGRASIQKKCGTMRVLDMSQPVGLNDIYINVNLLEYISGRRQLEVADLLKVDSDEFERPSLGKIAQNRVNGLEAVKKYSKLIVLGKPGAGKTTFLKYIAIQCSHGSLHANLVPIFITLKDFAETEQQPSLLDYITAEFSNYGSDYRAAIEQLLSQGKVLVLLDGLDEVGETDINLVLQEIRNFTAQFNSNHFVMSCRIAADDYLLENFTEVEIADFDSDQISAFASKWFAAKDAQLGQKFLQKLNQNPPIQELATIPLLLILLCLMFEDSADFPSDRTELYKEGLSVLLKKWDAKRNIERDQHYQQLSVHFKENLLSYIAFKTFEQGNYLFNTKEVEQHIADYICNLPGAGTDIEALQLKSKAVLKSIEAQHGLLVERAQGIYSFSHLTFHEYFTAREIIASANPQVLDTALRQLASRVSEKRWREVILLTVTMLRNGDYLLQLLEEQIDRLVAQDNYLQAFLTWLNQKSRAVTAPYKLGAVRAFYIALKRCLNLVDSQLPLNRALILSGSTLEIAFALDHTLGVKRNMELDPALRRTPDLALDRALTLALARALELNRVVTLNLSVGSDIDLALALELDLTRALDLALSEPQHTDLERFLRRLEAQLPDPDRGREKFKQWWKAKGGVWAEKLRAVMISHRQIGQNWQFSDQQQEALNQYYDANHLLVDCLNSHCYVTRAVREKIEETLFLPLQCHSN